jgi:hypothetical protein
MVLDKYREELKEADGFYDDVEEQLAKSEFKEGRQLVYIDNFNVFNRTSDGALMLVLEVKGCDKDNKECEAPQFFRIVNPAEAGLSSEVRKQGAFIFNFMSGLGIRFKPSELETVIPQIVMKKFYADVRVNESNGKKYINMYPLGFAEDSQVEEESEETPF